MTPDSTTDHYYADRLHRRADPQQESDLDGWEDDAKADEHDALVNDSDGGDY